MMPDQKSRFKGEKGTRGHLPSEQVHVTKVLAVKLLKAMNVYNLVCQVLHRAEIGSCKRFDVNVYEVSKACNFYRSMISAKAEFFVLPVRYIPSYRYEQSW
jgi:hypothetical protein